MKSWKTTLAGFIAGIPIGIEALVQANNAGTFTGKSGSQLAMAMGIVLLGLLSKDHNVSGTGK